MRAIFLTALGFSACRVLPSEPTDSQESIDSVADTDDTQDTQDTSSVGWNGDVVVFVTIDTITRDFLGRFSDWDTAPNLDALFNESTLFPNTMIVRSYTKASLTALHTGTYPRGTGVRDNYDTWENQVPDLFQLFKEAGYYTYGYSTNMCEMIDYNVDNRVCASLEEKPDTTGQKQSDQYVVDSLITALESRPKDQPLFIRLHLMDPHDPYNSVSEYYDEFHPEDYTGTFNPASPDAISQATLDNVRLSQEDLDHFHAIYASQIKSADAMIGQLFDSLKTMGLYDDALIIYGADHGDELATRSDYAYHGCSFYNVVMHEAYSFRIPGVAPQELDGWISTTDIAPTILELAGIDIPDTVDGHSLVSAINTHTSPQRPVFFERGVFTAGVVDGNYKYVLNPGGAYSQCAPFNGSDTDRTYANAVLEIYDLSADPDELNNLASEPPAEADALKTTLCTWITEDIWESEITDERNAMFTDCQEHLANK